MEKSSHPFNLQKTDMENQTMITEIFLLGFQYLHGFRVPFVLLIIFIYCLTVTENALIIALVSASKNLNLPMYSFLRYLSISDVLLTTDIVPNMINIQLNEGASISLAGCITQFYFFGSFLLSECFLLTAMSYDRYLAICRPLHYSSEMDERFCTRLVGICWLLGLTIMIISAVTISTFQFCEQNIINHFFCDLTPLLELSCSDTFVVEVEGYIFAGPVMVSAFLIIIASYVHIAFTILKINSNTGRQKAFGTCSSHLTVVSIFYGTLIGIYVVPTTGNLINISKFLSLLYTVVTPLLNPVIYSIRNNEMKEALNKFISIYRF